jgi:hypothetical protein
VLYTHSEKALAYYRDTMKRIVEASYAHELEVRTHPRAVLQ